MITLMEKGRLQALFSGPICFLVFLPTLQLPYFIHSLTRHPSSP